MLKKFSIALAVIIIGFSAGFSIVYAKIIPGVDRPFDPPDYYSDTAISYKDSPSEFFYKDLAANGGNVIDVARRIKSVLFGKDFKDLANIFKTKTKNAEDDTTPFDDSIFIRNEKNMDAINSITDKLTLSIKDNKLFRKFDRRDEDTNDYDEGAQASWLSDAYENFAQSAKTSIYDVKEEFDALDEIVDNSNNAIGNLQVNQASAQLKALNSDLAARRNALLANAVNMGVVEQKRQADDDLNGVRTTENFGGFFADPYNQDEYDNANYQKPKAPGFKNF